MTELDSILLLRRPFVVQCSACLKRVLQNAPNRIEPVTKADFFALFVAAVFVADGHFDNFFAQVRELGGNFRFEAEAILLEVDRLNGAAAEDLVAGFHVGKSLACQTI